MNYCVECGRGYEKSFFAALCGHIDESIASAWPASPLWLGHTLHEIQDAIHSIAVEESREALRLTTRYRVVRDGGDEWVEYLSNDNVWVPTDSEVIDESILSALHVDPSYLVRERDDDAISETQDATEGRR